MGAVADSLSPKQRRFLEAYLKCWNAAQAAREAGYSVRTARFIGAENLTKPNIAAAVKERLAEAAMSADEVLARLAEQARGDLGDFVEITDRGRRVRLNLEKAARAGKMRLLKRLSYNEHGPTIELHDAQAALVQLGRKHGLFKDNLNMNPDGPILVKVLSGVTMEEL